MCVNIYTHPRGTQRSFPQTLHMYNHTIYERTSWPNLYYFWLIKTFDYFSFNILESINYQWFKQREKGGEKWPKHDLRRCGYINTRVSLCMYTYVHECILCIILYMCIYTHIDTHTHKKAADAFKNVFIVSDGRFYLNLSFTSDISNREYSQCIIYHLYKITLVICIILYCSRCIF